MPRTLHIAAIATLAWAAAGPAYAAAGAENSGGFRGPQRSGIFPAMGLMKKWPEGGPKLLWEAKVGAGWTAASVADGRVFFCGLDGNSRDGAMVAFDLDGKQLWRTVCGPDRYRPRGTPAVADGVVYYEATEPVLYALDAATGKVTWSSDANTLGDTLAKSGGNSGSPLV
jgi:outer membrane protein assembly factor BamB